MFKRYLYFAGQTRMLWLTFIVTSIITFGVFQNLPHLDGLLIDTRFSYTHQELMALLDGIGAKGRATYLWANLVDMVFPLFYGSFFAGFLYRFRMYENLWMLALVPLLLVLADWGENIQIRMILLDFPAVDAGLAKTVSLFTSVKHVLSFVTIGCTGVVGVWQLLRKVKERLGAA